MRLDRYPGAHDFLAAAGGFLAEREAEHNLILGIARGLVDDAVDADDDAYLAAVLDGGQVVAAAMRTPPYNIIVSEVDDLAAVDLLADDQPDELPGAVGPPDVVQRLADRFSARTGAGWDVAMSELIYRLERVTPPSGVPGVMRPAGNADRRLLREWITAFGREALGEEDAERVRDSVEDWLAGRYRRLYLWEHGEPVSLAGAGGETPIGIRIGPVYTPPAFRRRGYASALTAAVSQLQLDQGRRFCFLYTDQANPTSNRIYVAIGYEQVGAALMVRFIRPP